MIIDTWWNDESIALVEVDGGLYALYGWNGEVYLHCWECIDRYKAADSDVEYIIRPVYDEDYKIIDYEVQ